jgi:glycosyltransferase involved in cell wall biosynthesis
MGAAGRALVERTFSWAVVADQTLDLYRELLE